LRFYPFSASCDVGGGRLAYQPPNQTPMLCTIPKAASAIIRGQCPLAAQNFMAQALLPGGLP
jgi:hypothetical protein